MAIGFLKIQVLIKTNNQFTNKDIKLQIYDTLESNYLNRETWMYILNKEYKRTMW